MKEVIYKAFTIFDYEEEEKWLNDMASKGKNFTDISLFRYVFEDGKPGEYIYRLEMLDKFPNHYKSLEYLRFLEETGIEHVASILKWVYLRKKASDGPFDVYSDVDSRINHYNRIIKLANLIIFIQLLIAFPNLNNFIKGYSLSSFCIFNFVFAIILFLGNRSLYKKVDKLEKEKLYKE